MGAGAKKKHEVYTVATTGGDTLVAVPEGDLPFLADGPITDAQWAQAELPAAAATPEAWEGVGLGPGAAVGFAEQGIVDPAEAKAWVDAGMGPDEAGSWAGNGFTMPAEAANWAGSGFTPDDAYFYADKGLTPVTAVVAKAEALAASAEPPAAEPEPAAEPAAEEPESSDGGDTEAAEAAGDLFEDVGAGSTLAGAGAVSTTAWQEAVTPVPEQLPVGDPLGVPLLVGGDDLVGASATVVAYAAPGDGPAREVLFCTISEEAEGKLLEALAPTNQKLVPKEVTKEVVGRLAVDEEQKLFDEMVVAAKSINHHLKAGDGMPDHTVARVATLSEQLAKLQGSDDPDVANMVSHYKPLVDAMAERIGPAFATPYDAGGKLATVTAFQAPHTVTETEWVPDTSEPTGADKLAASSRKASRVDPTIVDGKTVWDGKSRAAAQGVEYAIELPGGFTAVYHPYHYQGQNMASDHYSLRGQLEIHAPAGDGHGHELVDVLGSLNIVNRPMNGAEAEWVYLSRNVEAMGLGSHPQVAKARAASAKLEEAVAQQLMYDHAHEAVGLDEHGITALAQKLTLEAEAGALPLRVRMVRDAVAKASGYGTGQDLAADPAYQPTPRRCGGWMVFDRFDVAAKAEALKAKFGAKKMYCHITGGGSSGASILDIFRNGGVLASTERRRIMGAKKGSGMSESSDMVSGGAKATFVRVGSAGGSKNRIVWDDPLKLLRRTDWYAYPSDHFGSLNGASNHSTSGQTKDPGTVAGFSGSGNEVMFFDGIDLLGDEAPSKVHCSSVAERDAVRKLLAERGITKLGGRPVDSVIVA